jgi:hypothetical protein
MCWQCEVFDREMEHYRTLSARTTDEQTLKSLNILIGKLEAEKERLHVVEFKRPAKSGGPR